MSVQFRPMRLWPGPRTAAPRRAQFRKTYNAILHGLEYEVGRLRGEGLVVEIDAAPAQFRRDGQLYADAVLNSNGVIVRFEVPKLGELRYPCDRYDDWRDNLHAVALSLEALRAVDRHGVTRTGEQYTGFKAIAATSGSLSVEQAARLLAEKAGTQEREVLRGSANAKAAYLGAVRATHPDSGGSEEDFKRVQAAKAVLDNHFNGGGQ